MENQLIKKHHVLILGALKKCHITVHHPLFEDYLQIARWTLIETHRRFIKEDKPLDTFNNYVFQRIYWKITDEIRKEVTYTDRFGVSDDDENSLMQLADTPEENLMEIKDLLERLQPILTPQEKIFLEETYLNELSITAIAKKHHCSRQTVYNWRDRVALKTINFFKK